MKALSSTTRPYLSRFVYGSTLLLMGLAFCLSTQPVLAQADGTYSTPGLYSYTVPPGGPHQIRVAARGGDGGGYELVTGGSGASVASTFTVQSGDVVTIIVGEHGFSDWNGGINIGNSSGGGGGGGGSAVVVTRNGTPSLLAAAGGGGGGGVIFYKNSAFLSKGGGGQGTGPSAAGAGGPASSVSDFSSGGGGGGLQGPGGNGGPGNGLYPGGGGGGAASLTALSAGGTYAVTYNHRSIAGGRGFGGGGGAGGFDTRYGAPAGGGGGGYGGGKGAKSGADVALSDVNNPIYYTTGGYSNVGTGGTNSTITPGSQGGGQNRNGLVTISFPNNTATAAITTTNRSVCLGSSTPIQGTISATGSWTLVLSDGTVGIGSGSTFSIPVSPVTSTTYTLASLTDQKGFPPAANLTGQATASVIQKPTVNLTGSGPLSCAQTSVTLTATGGTSYTFSSGGTALPGANTSNTRAVSNPGEYMVQVTGANSCTNSATTTVTQSGANPLTVSLSSNGPITCTQTSVTLTASSNGTSYTFTNQGTVLPGDPSSNTRVVSSAGDYVVQVGGIGSCTKSTFTTVTRNQPLPAVTLLQDGPLACARPAVTLVAVGDGASTPLVSYTFTIGGIILEGDPSNRNRVVSEPGPYTVRVTGANGCTNVAGTTVERLAESRPSVSLTNTGPLTCSKPSVQVLATSSAATYRFYHDGILLDSEVRSSFRNVSEPGVYTVQVTGPNICTSVASTTVTSAMTLTATATASSTTALVGSLVSLSGSGGAGYQWLSPTGARLSSPATAPQVSATLTASGLQTFTLIVTQNACSQTLTVDVTAIALPDLTVSLNARPSTLYGNSPLTLVGNVSELNGVATTGRVSVRISTDSHLPLSFDPTASSVGGRLVNNRAWTFSGPSGGFYTLTSNQMIGAGGVLSFGVSGLLSPGGTTGLLSISSVVQALDFVEAKLNNNIDAEKIEYFQQ